MRIISDIRRFHIPYIILFCFLKIIIPYALWSLNHYPVLVINLSFFFIIYFFSRVFSSLNKHFCFLHGVYVPVDESWSVTSAYSFMSIQLGKFGYKWGPLHAGLVNGDLVCSWQKLCVLIYINNSIVWHFCFIGFSSTGRKPSEIMRLIVTTFIGVVFGFFLGVSFPTLSLTKVYI